MFMLIIGMLIGWAVPQPAFVAAAEAAIIAKLKKIFAKKSPPPAP